MRNFKSTLWLSSAVGRLGIIIFKKWVILMHRQGTSLLLIWKEQKEKIFEILMDGILQIVIIELNLKLQIQ